MHASTVQASPARRSFAADGLPFPPMPRRLEAALAPRGKAVFATRALPASPYALAPFLAEVEADPRLPEYAAVGFDGYGTNSWAVHCYLVAESLALFIQLPWGGIAVDAEPARAEIADLFGWSSRLQASLQAARSNGRISRDGRLQVVASRLGQAGWRWLAPGRNTASIPWNSAAGMKASIPRRLDEGRFG